MFTSQPGDANLIKSNFQPEKFDLANLKIFINSTPKTGNTWLKHLLSTIYDLPMVGLPNDYVPEHLANPGPRWVAHNHFYPQPIVLNWAEQNQVIFITTIRHPGDVFISLYNHSRNYAKELAEQNIPAYILSKDNTHSESNSIFYLKNSFFYELTISISWIHSQKSRIVRYEDLWRDPVATLQKLTDTICKVPLEQIEQAVELCNIDLLRNSQTRAGSKFFRTGKIGNWRTELGAEVTDIFRNMEPYPSQFAALGYNLDPTDPLMAAPQVLRNSNSPFHNISHFDNGVPVSPTLVKLYLSLDQALKQGWASVENTSSANSFFTWLGAPANDEQEVPISNLANYIYQQRSDLQQVFPDLYGKSRLDYLIWFMLYGRFDYQIEPALTTNMYAYFVDWSDKVIAGATGPVITNLLAYIYQQRLDLQQVFPDLYGKNRLDCLLWFMLHGRFEYRIEPAFIKNMHIYFVDWSVKVVAEDPRGEDAVPVITNLAAYIYYTRPDLQEKYPDLYGQGRFDYISWVLMDGRIFYKLEPEVILPILLSLISK